jgi:DUF2934 family protein
MSAALTAKESESQDLGVEVLIRERAYELYVLRGNASGSEMDDWFQAEQEIQAAQDREIEEGPS